jgi:hypothetical protein
VTPMSYASRQNGPDSQRVKLLRPTESRGYNQGSGWGAIACGEGLPHQSCIANHWALTYTAGESEGNVPCWAYAEKGATEGQTVVGLEGERSNTRGLVDALAAGEFCTRPIR